MATIKFRTRGTTKKTKIYIDFTAGREVKLRVSTPLTVNPKYFNNDKGALIRASAFKEYGTLKTTLKELDTYIDKCYNEAIKQNIIIDTSWLKNCINVHFGVLKVTDLSYLVSYAEQYADKLKIKTKSATGQLGMSKHTISKYKTIAKKLKDFDKYRGKKHKLYEINLNYKDDFLTYLLDVEYLAENTAGRYIKFLKTICLDAQRSGQKVSSDLLQIKGFTVKTQIVYLNFDELDQIEALQYEDERLEATKDWLIIGCYLGQRSGDLLQFTKEVLVTRGGLNLMEFKQQKTQKLISIPIPPKVQEILDKRGGCFPLRYSDNRESSTTIFNKYIKVVCEDAGLTSLIRGGLTTVKQITKNGKKTNVTRKKWGNYKKYELVTSHICRRSFCSNYYGEIPTPYLMGVSGHGTEEKFLTYIGKTSLDNAHQMAEYWQIQAKKQEIKKGTEMNLKIAK